MLDVLFRPAIWAPLALLLAISAYQSLTRRARLPDLPIVGAEEGEWLPLTRARWRNTLDPKRAITDAYAKHKHRTVVLPLADFVDRVVLPASETQFVVDQSASVLGAHESVGDRLQLDYTCSDPRLIHNPVHHDLVKTTLTSQVGKLIPDIVEEARFAFDKHWGASSNSSGNEFSDVVVYETMRRIVGAVTNRVLVGEPLCRDGALLDAGTAYARDLPRAASLLRLIWRPLRPLVAPFVTRSVRGHTARFRKILLPEITRRLREYDARASMSENSTTSYPERKEEKRVDFLQWSISQAKASGDPYMWEPATLAGRVLQLNLAAIHTSTLTMTAAILDLAASKPEHIRELRDEVSTVLEEHGGVWNKRALRQMVKLDSLFRESARLNSFVTLGLNRVVTARNGLVTPSGIRLPQGTHVCVPCYAVLRDGEVYEDAQTFEPFRFAVPRTGSQGEEKGARKTFTTTGNDYLVFGHGRSACPGRFFAANELKLMMAYLLVNYDMEQLPARPRDVWVGFNRLQSFRATIRIKKRGN
ncbi:cytochrome P450 [Coniochaeta sp. 2T2.1]|nr:cytochrome P450 [Coniochaeta sp. 2T2.1]